MAADIQMAVIIIGTPKDIFIGEDMITGIILTDHTWVEFIMIEESTTNGTGIITIVAGIVINIAGPLLMKRFSDRFAVLLSQGPFYV